MEKYYYEIQGHLEKNDYKEKIILPYKLGTRYDSYLFGTGII